MPTRRSWPWKDTPGRALGRSIAPIRLHGLRAAPRRAPEPSSRAARKVDHSDRRGSRRSASYRLLGPRGHEQPLIPTRVKAHCIPGFSRTERVAGYYAHRPPRLGQCMMLSAGWYYVAYAGGWRRLAPLFSIRAYRHIARPVEINPWLERNGRGTFPNAVRAVERAARWLKEEQEPTVDGGMRQVRSYS